MTDKTHGGSTRTLRFGTRSVELSRLDKVLFPDDGITKGELVDYHAAVAEAMLPQLHDRPLAFARYPDGIGGETFFQQAAPQYFPDWIKRVSVTKQDGRGEISHALCQDRATLAYLAGQAAITLHTWLAKADRPDRPDQVLFDLDPPTGRFDEVRLAARTLHGLLDELGLPCVVKTTGGRGLHVSVPVARREDADALRDFARDVAGVLAAREPERFTTEVRKAQRGGRLYLDISRNAYAQLAVAPYTVRARAGAPVATPLAWSELDDGDLTPDQFTVRTVPARLEKGEDPWKTVPAPVTSLADARRRIHELAVEADSTSTA
jgi:bifunctional non-homologous end joining protein LigD